MSKPFYVRLKDRGRITVAGENARNFLQSLVTNDLDRLRPDNLVYACLLNPQGKYLHDFFIGEENGILTIDCEGSDRTDHLYALLMKYKLRAKVTLEKINESPVYAVFGGGCGKADPRHPDMGARCLEQPQGLDEHSFDDWDMRRIRLGIPDGSRDLEIERSTLDEGSLQKFNAVDFSKGCYVGQELTARIHYRGLGKKHLYPVRLNTPLPALKSLPHGGQMRSSCGEIGLALLRDDSLEKDYDGLIKVLGHDG